MRTYQEQRNEAQQEALKRITKAQKELQKAINTLQTVNAYNVLITGQQSQETTKQIKQLYDIKANLYFSYKQINEE